MSLSSGKVGIAPGTTTLVIGQGGSISLVGAELGYFDARPTDFDMSRRSDYLPVHRGWLNAKYADNSLGSCCSSCSVGGPCGGLGQDEPETAPEATQGQKIALTAEQQASVAKFVTNQLELEAKVLELKERRSRRFWGAVAGLATATTALVAVLSYKNQV